MGRLSDCSHYMARECKTMVQRCLPVKAINCHLAVARCRPLTAARTKCSVTLDEPPHPSCLIIRLLIACARCHSVSTSPLPSPFSFLFSPQAVNDAKSSRPSPSPIHPSLFPCFLLYVFVSSPLSSLNPNASAV
jgi:hypothetical protein